MGSEWQILTVQECASSEPFSTQIGPFGKALMADSYKKFGVPVLRGINVNHGRFNDNDFVFVDEITADKLFKFESFPDDVLLVHKGTLGKIGIMPKRRKFPRYIMGNSMMRVRCNPSILLPDYLYYWLSSPAGQHYIFSRVSQVGVPQIQTPLSTLRQAELSVPPISEQLSITRTLGAIDDKIDLLRETNATLEDIAQALFKSWFVDYDPVHAKTEGREPEGVPPEVADLFPNQFEVSELGAIPKGWRVSPLEEHLEVIRGLSYKGSGLTNSTDPEGVPMHNLNSVLEGGGYKYAGLKYYNGEFKEKHQIRSGDLIVANTEQGHKHLLIGFPAIVPARIGKVGLFSHHLYRVRPFTNSPVRSQFAYRLLLTPVVREQVISCANGTTVNMLKADGLSKPRFVCPPATLIQAFDELALSIQRKQECNVTQAESLSDLRDTLLPRLISGKLRIPSAIEVPA